MATTATKSLKDSNAVLRDLIMSDEPWSVIRLSDSATKVSLSYLLGQKPPEHMTSMMQSHDGIYVSSEADMELYARTYNKAVGAAKHICCFPKLCVNEQNIYLAARKESEGLHNRCLEPFYIMKESGFHDKPWTHALAGKKVLIIHPFIESFKNQMAKDFTFFGDTAEEKRIFLPSQEFVYYKAFNCLSGVRPHKNWFETFSVMARDIAKLDFDIALLGCGGYGVPLCNYIATKLKKKAIYVGGSLQLLFGVVGQRWLTHDVVGPLLTNGTWIRPSDEEHITGFAKIEGGCYW